MIHSFLFKVGNFYLSIKLSACERLLIRMDTCQFSYIQRTTYLPITALGFEQSWEQLKVEFDYHGPGYPGAICYKTISLRGPELFAVVNNEWVLYYENEQWHRYISAIDIKLGRMNMMLDEPERATTEEQNQAYFDMATQQDHLGVHDTE